VEAFKKYTRDEIEQRFDKHNIPPGPVYELDEMFEDPQVIHNDMVVEMEHEAYGNIKVTGFPVKLSDTPPTVRSASATVGQHNEEILREFGYSGDEVRALQDAEIVGSENLKRNQAAAAD
jgi:crotonobetainyl-CoA:carnitine CoA-transferase CaiB-like acyl-CoA transferase